MNAVDTERVSKVYGGLHAVHDLDLCVPAGEVFGLLGPNGAGKTTTIMMLLGAVKPSSGRATLLGKPVGHVPTRRHVGFLPEKFQFHDFLTATEFLQLHGKLAGLGAADRRRRVPQVLDRVGLADRARSRIREFSKGMQQRLGLAQALIAEPDLVILDEPTSALDPLGRRDVRDIVADLRSQGKTVILNSHLLSEIEMTCDRVAIMKRGKVAVQGTMAELLAFSSVVDVELRALKASTVAAARGISGHVTINGKPVDDANRAADDNQVAPGPVRMTALLRTEDEIPELARALVESGADLMSLTPQRETLEQLFVRVVSSAS